MVDCLCHIILSTAVLYARLYISWRWWLSVHDDTPYRDLLDYAWAGVGRNHSEYLYGYDSDTVLYSDHGPLLRYGVHMQDCM